MEIVMYYSGADDTWTVRVDDTRHIFSTQLEAVIMKRKLEFAQVVRMKITELDNLIAYLSELQDIFQDSGYASGGDNAIVDEDLEAVEMTAVDLANVNTFIENIKLFYHDGTPMQFNYAFAINRFRNF